MARADLKRGGKLVYPCPNCGAEGKDGVQVVAPDGSVGWSGCVRCWPWVVQRGQLWVVQDRLRQVYKPTIKQDATGQRLLNDEVPERKQEVPSWRQ